MKISKLDTSHSEQIRDLYRVSRYMGVDVAGNWDNDVVAYNDFVFGVFQKTYLSGLANFQAYALFDDAGQAQCLISLYDSSDEPSWYYTMCRSRGNTELVKQLFDQVICMQEAKNRFKFYTLVNVKHAPLLRKFTYSNYNDQRYGYYDEFVVPARTRCYYNNAWELLFKKVLLPVDTVVRCSYLKQEHRGQLPVGGSI